MTPQSGEGTAERTISGSVQLWKLMTRSRKNPALNRSLDHQWVADAATLIELGSGTSDKTRLLLDVIAPRRFLPFDVSDETLRASAQRLAREYPDLDVRAVVGDFEHHLQLLPGNGRRLLAFLGSTIGNLPPARRTMFLSAVAATLGVGDSFLLGVDLVRPVALARLIWHVARR